MTQRSTQRPAPKRSCQGAAAKKYTNPRRESWNLSQFEKAKSILMDIWRHLHLATTTISTFGGWVASRSLAGQWGWIPANSIHWQASTHRFLWIYSVFVCVCICMFKALHLLVWISCTYTCEYNSLLYMIFLFNGARRTPLIIDAQLLYQEIGVLMGPKALNGSNVPYRDSKAMFCRGSPWQRPNK